MIAVFNLVGAIVLMLASWMESPAEFAKPMPRLWQVWEQVDAVLGFVMAAGMFAASIGLFLWKPWARKLTLGVCIFGLASLVFDAPYLARFAIPDIYADIEQTVIAEGIERDLRDFVTLTTFVVVFGGFLAVSLTCLIGQVIYFTRPRVVAAFESQGEKRGKFSEWLFTGAGAVAGVLSVFGPLALLLGIAALFKLGDGEQKTDSSVASPSAAPSKADARSVDDKKPATLFDAAGNGQVDRVKQLLDAGSSINAKDADGQTPLLKAVAGGHESLALTLILLGADLTDQDRQGRSALMIAAEKGDAAFLSRLRDLSQITYDPDATKRKERLRAFPGIEHSLLAGRDVDLAFFSLYDAERLTDADGENAVMKATRSGDWECFQLLATQTDTLLAQDKLGRTTLVHAILSGQTGQSRWNEQFERLTKPPLFGVAGVDNIYVGPLLIFELERSLSLLDNDGKSAVQLAEEHKHPEIARTLRRHLEMVITNQTAEFQKGGESAAKHLRLRALAWRALGEIEKSEADFKKALPE
ncbi:MAG TPA: ankyrin repeat domain-containing protein [Planctomycetaceae bacterium]|nr:ankyrin repeat domain-containing protein [Planctomycetaceae bacterium]